MNDKISIIMPTYNDSDSIKETLDSVFSQTYNNWELIIINDGSTDATEQVILQYKQLNDKNNKIQYYYQENQDQLNAILTATSHIAGDYIYILHSDDLLNETTTLEKCINYMNSHTKYDAIISDLILIDENSAITGIQRTAQYTKSNYILPLQLLWLGRNLYVDGAFYRKHCFLSNVRNTYLTWNMPFWITIKEDCSLDILNVKKVNFQFTKYRVYEGNYINNFNGKLNVINGELRTVVTLMKNYNIPFYRVQYIIYRIFNKLKISKFYRPIYQNREQKNKGKILEFIIKKRFGNQYIENLFLNALVIFYKNPNHREIYIGNISDEVYQGKDIRKFNNLLLDNKLSSIYMQILSEMEKGFDKIIVESEIDYSKITDICKFLCIYPFIKIEVKSDVNS